MGMRFRKCRTGLVVRLVLVFSCRMQISGELVSVGVEEVIDVGVGMGRILW